MSDNNGSKYDRFMGASKQFVSSLLGAGVLYTAMAWWGNRSEMRRHKLEWEEKLQNSHVEYSKCMRTIYRWNKEYGNDASQKFKDQVQSKNTSEEAEEVNKCRSLCKDYWRNVFSFQKEYGVEDENVRKTFKSRYDRFKSQVKPLDVLDGYEDGAELDVFELPRSLNSKYQTSWFPTKTDEKSSN